MESDVTALGVDGRVLGPPAMRSATLSRTGEEWALSLIADWSSHLCDRIRRDGSLPGAELLITTAAGTYSGRARLEFAGEIENDAVEVLGMGIGRLAAAPSIGNADKARRT